MAGYRRRQLRRCMTAQATRRCAHGAQVECLPGAPLLHSACSPARACAGTLARPDGPAWTSAPCQVPRRVFLYLNSARCCADAAIQGELVEFRKHIRILKKQARYRSASRIDIPCRQTGAARCLTRRIQAAESFCSRQEPAPHSPASRSPSMHTPRRRPSSWRITSPNTSRPRNGRSCSRPPHA